MKHLVKNGNRIKGFVYQSKDSWWYAFGKPSQEQYIAFACRDLEHGIACIEVPTLNNN
jgi:hypothetical protein